MNDTQGSLREEPFADTNRRVLIEEEINAHREAREKMRSTLYKALMGGTKASLEQGCLRALSILDDVGPVMRGGHGGNETSDQGGISGI